jgi:hypothetical protein
MASGRETGLARERSSETAAERPVHRRGPNPAAPAGTVAAPAPAAVLHWQRTAGNTAVGSMLRGVQRQPVRTPRPPLGAKAIAAAVTDVSKRYDADSIRLIQNIATQPTTGAFTAADATALATFQTAQGVVPVTGNADEAFVDFLLGKLGAANFAAHDALIHLVADRADLDVSGVLNVRWDPAAVPPPQASLFDAAAGGGEIFVGNEAFKSSKALVKAIKTQIAAAKKAPTAKATAVGAAVLKDVKDQAAAVAFNQTKLSDPRSIRIMQRAIGAKRTGAWDAGTVRHLAQKQQSLGGTGDGKVNLATMAEVTMELISQLEQDAVLQLIIDFFDLDRAHAFTVYFEPNPPATVPATANAESLAVGLGVGGSTRFFPNAFAQPFAGLVHTVAHELGHIDQVVQGIANLQVREFLSYGIAIESRGMPEEAIEPVADLTAMMSGQQPAGTPAFTADAVRFLIHWTRLSAAEKATNHARFIQIRQIVVDRIHRAPQPQQTALAPLITKLNAADNGVP